MTDPDRAETPDRTDDPDGTDGDGAPVREALDHVRLADLEGRPGARALDGSPRVIRLALDAGEAVPPHDHPGTTVVLHVVEGVLDARLGGESVEVAAGELLRFDGDRDVAPLALEDATALVYLVEDG